MDLQVNKLCLFTGASHNCFTIMRRDTKLIKIFNKIINETNLFQNFKIIHGLQKINKVYFFRIPFNINNKIAKSHYDTIRKKFIKWFPTKINKVYFMELLKVV